MNISPRGTETDLSALNDDDLESTVVLSDFLTRFHGQIVNNITDSEDESETESDDDDKINSCVTGHNEESIVSGGAKKKTFSRKSEIVISPQDIMSAMEYRHDMERYTLLSSLISVVKQPNFYASDKMKKKNHDEELDKILKKETQRIWQRMQTRVTEGRMSTDKDVGVLLEATGVRVTKEISTEMLLNQSSSTMQPSCSTLLGVPSGNYLSVVLPKCLYEAKEIKGQSNKFQEEIDENRFAPTLPVPANFLTWKELLRLSNMVSKIPEEDRSAIFSSPLTNSNMTGANFKESTGKAPNIYMKDKHGSEEKLLLSRASELRGTDLLALWVRAQRDTGASRHLLALFDIVEAEDDNAMLDVDSEQQGNKRTEINDENYHNTRDDNDCNNEIPKEISFVPSPEPAYHCGHRYIANFVGNPSKLRNRIEKEAPLLDKLTEWAVINQVLFTQEHIREQIPPEMEASPSACGILNTNVTCRKRSGDDLVTTKKSKRRSKEKEITGELMVGIQSYVLKWFARRNKNILRIVYSSDSVDKGTMHMLSSLNLQYSKCTKQIKAYLNKHHQSTDRTLSRINRRIFLQKYEKFSSFKDTVNQLLEALGSTVSKNNCLSDKVKTAQDDFDQLCKHVLQNDGEDCRIPEYFYEDEGDDAQLMINILKSHAKPWIDKCDICEQKMSEETSRTCWNCERAIHVPCISSEVELQPQISLDKLKHLLALYMSIEDFPEIPDFVNKPVQWERKKIRLHRRPTENGELPEWGMTTEHTDICEKAYNQGIHNIIDPSKWDQIDWSRPYACSIPVRIPYSGFLVVGQSRGPSMESGLEIGDVIVEVGSSKMTAKGEETLDLKKITMKQIEHGDQGNPFASSSRTTVVCTVYRPSKSIINIAEAFKRCAVRAYDESHEIHRKLMRDRWYCGNCGVREQSSEKADGDALRCKMVVRRLGMEQHYIPFHDENTTLSNKIGRDDGAQKIDAQAARTRTSMTEIEDNNSTNDGHNIHISLRRLDQMLELISKQQSSGKGFFTPPWKKRERLSWVKEEFLSKPTVLLCAGMVLLVGKAKWIGVRKSGRKEIVERFVRTFVPWCLDYNIESDICRTNGPPLCARKLFAPWTSKACQKCEVRAAESSCAMCTLCSKSSQQSFNKINDAEKNGVDMEEERAFTETVSPELLSQNETLHYDLYCSYIGTSLLVPISDPLVASVLQKTQLVVDEGRRSVELLVISYVPSRLISTDNTSGLVFEESSDGIEDQLRRVDGLFYVLPILSHYQMNFISQFCESRRPNQFPSDSQMLQLEGIIALTPTELKIRLQATLSILAAVDKAVGSIATKFGKSKLPWMVVDSDEQIIGPRSRYVDPIDPQISEFDHVQFMQISNTDDFVRQAHYEYSDAKLLSDAIYVCLDRQKLPSLAYTLKHNSEAVKARTKSNGAAENFESSLDKTLARKKSRMMDTDSRKGSDDQVATLKYLDGMISLSDSNAQKLKFCQTFYNDFIYWGSKERNHVKKKVSKKVVTDMVQLDGFLSKQPMWQPQPFRQKPSDKKEIAVLHRDFCRQTDDSDEEYDDSDHDETSNSNRIFKFHGKGWGMELVEWSNDKGVLRIGRIAPSSPSHLAGLLMHDVVTAINGIPVHAFNSRSAIAKELLGEFGGDDKFEFEKYPAVPYLFRARNERPARGPVILNISRSEINVKTPNRRGHEPMNTPGTSPTSSTRRSQGHRKTQLQRHKDSASRVNVRHRLQVQTAAPSSQINGTSQSKHTNAPTHQSQSNVEMHTPLALPASFVPPHPEHHHHIPQLQPQPHQQNNRQNQQNHFPHQHNNLPHQHDHRPFQQNNIPPQQNSLPSHLLEGPHQQKAETLQATHLYSVSVGGSFLTLAETSVLVHAINLNHPKLSTRLLSPRYPYQRVNDEYVQIIKPHIEQYGLARIPKLSEGMWQSILQLDHKRMKDETGPVLFYEHGFGYKVPNKVLPVDRFFESYFKKLNQQMQLSQSSYIDLTNNSSQNEVHTYSTNPQSDILRIRGGGETNDESSLCHLLSEPFHRLEGKGVFGYVENKHGEKDDENIFVGIVSSANVASNCVEIECFYTSDVGRLPSSQLMEMSCHQEIFFIPTAELTDSILELIQKAKWSFKDLRGRSTKDAVIELSNNRSNGTEGVNYDASQSEVEIMKSRAVRLLKQMQESSSPLLGALPDGRNIYWFHSDPNALYFCGGTTLDLFAPIATPELSSLGENATQKSRKLKSSLMGTDRKNSVYCPWGCCAKPADPSKKFQQILSFDSMEKLRDHIFSFHSYCTKSQHRRFFRVSDAKTIRNLCADLTSHICLSASHLREYTCDYVRSDKDCHLNHMNRAIIFDLNKFPNLQKGLSGLNVEGAKTSKSTRTSMRLWDRISCLFNIEGNGSFRLPKSYQCLKPIDVANDNSNEEKLFLQIKNGIDSALPSHEVPFTWQQMCFDGQCARFKVDKENNLNCRLCRQTSESVVQSKNGEGKIGVGCSLLSDLCFSATEYAIQAKFCSAIEKITPSKSDLDVLKVLMMRIASNIPQSLYASTMSMFSDLERSYFWDRIDVWIRFLCRCSNIRMISQALTMLQSSIKKSLMPRWWKANKSGWSSSLVILQNPSLSKIAVQALHFDTAVAEYIATAKVAKNQVYPAGFDEKTSKQMSPSPEVDVEIDSNGVESRIAFVAHLEKMDVIERLKLLEKLATKFDLPLHEGEYAEVCMVCENGGDLVCCEYCQNVVHQHCFGYEGDLDDVIFVCKECTDDIAALKVAWDKDPS